MLTSLYFSSLCLCGHQLLERFKTKLTKPCAKIIDNNKKRHRCVKTVNHFFHYVFSTNSFLPFTWFLLKPFTYFTMHFSQHVLSTGAAHAFYPTFFNSRDLHLSCSCILPYVFSITCFTLKPIMHFSIGFFQHAFSTKAIQTFYTRFFRARTFH